MQADFQIIADSKDITDLIRDRLLDLRIVDKQGLESDEVEINLDDRDGRVVFPPKGATLRVSLGWRGRGLNYMGSFVVDEVKLSGPPSSIGIKGRPADLRQESRSHADHSYEDTTLAEIVSVIAGRNRWEPVCRVDAIVPRADQIGESDINFITRIARQHGATATVKDGKLLVLPRDGGASSSGKVMPAVNVSPADLIRWSLSFPDRSGFKAVKAKFHNNKTGEQGEILALNDDGNKAGVDGEHVDKHVYPSKEAAQAAASSRKDDLNRNTASGSLSMTGRADVAAEKHIILAGFKAGADGRYLIESVTHTYDGQSWITDIGINAGNEGKAKVGKKKKGDGEVI